MAADMLLDTSNSQAVLLDTSNVAAPGALLDASYSVAEADPPIYAALTRLKPEHLSYGRWAEEAGHARNLFTNMRKHGNPDRQTVENLLNVIGVSVSEFEADLGGVRTEVRGAGAVGPEVRELFFGKTKLAPLPLYGSALGGEYGNVDEHIQLTELDLTEVLDYLVRPVGLADDKDAYALTIVGESMSPRFRPGERVGVSPRAQISVGDDVIVQLRNGRDHRVRMVLIKELERRNGTHVVLRQHNPPISFRIELSKIAAMHKVKGNFF